MGAHANWYLLLDTGSCEPIAETTRSDEPAHSRSFALASHSTANRADTGGISGLDVIQLEYSFKLKIRHNDLLLADTCPQAANHCALS